MDKIVDHVIDAKSKDLPFSVLDKAFDTPPNENNFKKYLNEVNKRHFRMTLSMHDYKYFSTWGTTVSELIKFYGNNPDAMCTLIHNLGEDVISGVAASLHDDRPDVIHYNCFGYVKWKLKASDQETREEYKDKVFEITLEPNQVIYIKGMTLHETTPLTKRGSLIFRSFTDIFYKNETEDMVNYENSK
jgi:hypothetical protein